MVATTQSGSAAVPYQTLIVGGQFGPQRRIRDAGVWPEGGACGVQLGLPRSPPRRPSCRLARRRSRDDVASLGAELGDTLQHGHHLEGRNLRT